MNWLCWLILIIVLAFLEVATINLVTIWFIMSGLVSLGISFITDNFLIQFSIFVVLGIILLFTTRPLFKKFLRPRDEKTNLDRVIGMIGVVTEEIDRNVVGEVRVDGKKWSAVAKELCKVGDEVVIEEIKGVKLIVKKEGKN